MFLVTIYFVPGRKHPIMIIDGYEFKLSRHSEESSIWICTQQNRQKCKSRLLSTGQEIRMKSVPHNHEKTFKSSYENLKNHVVHMSYCDTFFN